MARLFVTPREIDLISSFPIKRETTIKILEKNIPEIKEISTELAAKREISIFFFESR